MSGKPFDYRNARTIEQEKRVGVPMELRCGPCGRAGLYPVARVCLDPSRVDPLRTDTVNEAFGFTGYFHCQFCGAGGPWNLTNSSRMLLAALMREALVDPENARLIPVQMVLFDGTPSRWPTQGEAHLKALIDKEPDRAFLWNRLGNLYKTADAYQLAIETYGEALKRDPHDVESMHSLGQIYENEGKHEQSATWHHQALLHARHAPAEVPAQLVRDLVDDSLKALLRLHQASDGRTALLPELPEDSSAGPSARAILEVHRNASSKEDGRERVIDLWVGSRAPRMRTLNAPRPALPAGPTLQPRRPTPSKRHVGRNDPCPCGSGKKFKVCCGRS